MQRFLEVFFLAVAFALRLSAQTVQTDDPRVIVTAIEGPVEGSVSTIAVGDGTAWILTKHELLKVNPKDNLLVSIPVEEMKNYGFGTPSMAIGGGSLWAFGNAHNVGGIHRIDPATGTCIATIRLDKRKGETSIAYGMRTLWVLNQFDGTLLRVDPDTNQIAATIQVGKGFWAPLSVGDGAVWVMDVESGTVRRVDPQLNKIVDEFSAGPRQHGVFSPKAGIYMFSVGEGSLWVADRRIENGDYTLFRINPATHERVATILVKYSIGPPVFWNSSVWVSTIGSSAAGHLVTEIDSGTNKVLATHFLPRTTLGGQGASPATLLAEGDSLWAISEGSSRFSHLLIRRIEPKHL
jgi:DNA-binding beta-propeller fold protein YncE